VKKVLAAALLLATPVAADEVWNSNWGQVVYLADVGSTAVLTVPYSTDLAHIYLPGMAGNFEQRGLHDGYWISADAGPCDATMTGPDGVSSTNWGRVTLIFDNPAYPSGFTALWGICMMDPQDSLNILRATF
jgi:hypothetical protein